MKYIINERQYRLLTEEEQEVLQISSLNVFGGYNDGLVNNGEDIKTLNYSEFIAPLVKAVQELHLELKMVKEILNEKSLIIDDLKKELQELKK